MDYKKLKVYFGDQLVDFADANVSVAGSAVLYGLSVYPVFAVSKGSAAMVAFRLPEHYRRLTESAHIIGIDTFQEEWSYERFTDADSRR